MAGSSDLYMKDRAQEREREREKVERRESGRGKRGDERVRERCGLTKENVIFPLPGELRVLFS